MNKAASEKSALEAELGETKCAAEVMRQSTDELEQEYRHLNEELQQQQVNRLTVESASVAECLQYLLRPKKDCGSIPGLAMCLE